jgi:hypothetical protein
MNKFENVNKHLKIKKRKRKKKRKEKRKERRNKSSQTHRDSFFRVELKILRCRKKVKEKYLKLKCLKHR